MTRVVLVAGTHGLEGPTGQWWWPTSPFAQFLGQHDISLVASDPFEWSTGLNGVVGQPMDWVAGGTNLRQYLVPPLCPDRRVPGAEVNLIAHSHGLQVVLYAAQMGLKINRLISVCSPVRWDVMRSCPEARANIKSWLHLFSDETDYMQVLGEFFDQGHFGIVRRHPWADANAFIGPGLGHGDILRDPANFHLWMEKGWLDGLATT